MKLIHCMIWRGIVGLPDTAVGSKLETSRADPAVVARRFRAHSAAGYLGRALLADHID